MKLFLFGIGDESIIKDQVMKLKKMNINYEIGPSNNEHQYLMKNVPFYKKSYDEKIYAFCSDVGRMYKLSKESGLYVDAISYFGEKFDEYMNFIGTKNIYCVFQSGNSIGSDILFSSEKGKWFFKELFNQYKKMEFHPRSHGIGPSLLQGGIRKFFKDYSPSGNAFENESIYIDTPENAYNVEKRLPIGSGSGLIKNKDKKIKAMTEQEMLKKFNSYMPNQYWFNRKKEKKYIKIDRLVSNIEISNPSIGFVRSVFENAKSEKERDEMLKAYKYLVKNEKIHFFDKLFGSRMYLFFTGKNKE